MILLVCGGRNYADRVTVNKVLSQYIDKFDTNSVVIQGGAPGADKLASIWCLENGIHSAEVPALWHLYTRRAGPIRNSVMLLLRPDMVIAFPGGTGTENMVKQAKEKKITVIRI